MKFSYLSKYYKYLSIIFLNFILIFIILNLACFITIKIYHQYHPYYWPTDELTELQEVYPGMSLEDISGLLEESWKRPMIYSDWVGFKERPISGEFVNISPEGFRYSGNKSLTLNSEGKNIYVFGGSTTFGYGVDDNSTIAAHLQKFLSKAYPKKNINVFNFGRAYYYSSQELALLTHLIRKNKIPSIAIFIDGLNEGQKNPYFSHQMKKLFVAYNYEPWKRFKYFIEKTSLFKILNIFIYGNKDFNLTRPLVSEKESVRIYQTNKKMINALAKKHKFKTYFFIQPVPGYKNKFENHKFMPDDINEERIEWETTKMKLLEITTEDKNSFDFTALLSGYEKQPFVDAVHYTEDVSRKLAKRISTAIEIY
jgi:hypothetical protein